MDNFYLRVIKTFNQFNVEYLLIGGFAVNFHGYNRTTGDMDLWISKSDGNLKHLTMALDELGYSFTSEGRDELRADHIVSFSEGVYTTELMTRLNISREVSFEEARERSVKRMVQGIEIHVISMEDLKNEKARSGRYKDLDDLSQLEKQE